MIQGALTSERIFMMPAPYSIDLRTRVVSSYENKCGSYRQLATRYHLSPSTVQDWVHLKRETGSVAARPHGGGLTLSIQGEDREKLRQIHQDNPDGTLAELRQWFQAETSVSTSVTTVHRALSALGLTRKKKTFSASEQDRNDVKADREQFRIDQKEMNPEDLIIIDEMGVNLAMSRLYARSAKGERAYAKKPCNKGVKLSVIGALGLNEMVTALSIEGAVNGHVFSVFIKEMLVPKLKSGQIVLMDNLSAHKVDGIQEAIEVKGAKLQYFPSYSPDFSPIEECWSKIKEILRKIAARTKVALDEALTVAFNAVTNNDIKGWFKHCGYCTEPT